MLPGASTLDHEATWTEAFDVTFSADPVLEIKKSGL